MVNICTKEEAGLTPTPSYTNFNYYISSITGHGLVLSFLTFSKTCISADSSVSSTENSYMQYGEYGNVGLDLG